MRKSITLPGFIQAIAVAYIVAWSISTPMEIDLIYRFIALGLAAIWAVIAFMRNIQFDTIHIWALLFTVSVVIITYFTFHNISSIIKQISWYMMFVELIIFSFYNKKNLWHEISWVIPVVFILLTFFNFKTASVLIEDPTIARLIVRADEETYAYMRQGVGGYALVYTQVLFFPAALIWIINSWKVNKIKFVFGLAWLISYFFLIANAGYSIAIFSTVSAVLILFFYKGKSVVGVVIVTMLFFIGVMAAILYLTPFREWLLVTFDGTAVAKKINDLVASSESGEAEGSIADRVNQYVGSFKSALFEYPVIGSLWRTSSAGTHSHILDTFAKYGLWGGILNLRVLYIAPSFYRKKYQGSKTVTAIFNAELTVMILVSLLDTLPYQLMCAFFLIVPILTEDIINWKGEKNEGSLVG